VKDRPLFGPDKPQEPQKRFSIEEFKQRIQAATEHACTPKVKAEPNPDRKRNAHAEDDEQKAVIQWCRANRGRWPQLRLIYAIPNGAFLAGEDKLDRAKRFMRLKASGVRPAVLDLNLPVARGGYIGLWIEMKSATGRVTPEQQQEINDLRAEGHRVEVCYSAREATAVIEDYMTERKG
jgi:hypothetical protein